MASTNIDKNQIPTKLLWMDLEMTGLDPRADAILEVAIEVTDFKFNTLASYEAVISQPQAKLDRMNDWCLQQHTKSGLLDRLKTEGRPESEVVAEVCDLIREQFIGEAAVLAGNSIHNDRMFISSWWPDVEDLLHYRMLDVSSFKILMQAKYHQTFTKKEVHRAYDDIQASIAELQFYLDCLQMKPEKIKSLV